MEGGGYVNYEEVYDFDSGIEVEFDGKESKSPHNENLGEVIEMGYEYQVKGEV